MLEDGFDSILGVQEIEKTILALLQSRSNKPALQEALESGARFNVAMLAR